MLPLIHLRLIAQLYPKLKIFKFHFKRWKIIFQHINTGLIVWLHLYRKPYVGNCDEATFREKAYEMNNGI